MDVRAPRAARLLAVAAALAAALLLAAPGSASGQELRHPPSQAKPPRGFALSAKEVRRIADGDSRVRAERERRGALYAVAYTKGRSLWQVGYFQAGRERAQVTVDDRTGRVLESWTGPQVAWRMARGYEGAFGRKLNAPYVWLPLCALFLLPFVDPRRPFRLLHLDLLVLLGFGVSHVFFNRGDISTSVPLVYPVLAYLLVRMLVVGFRGRESVGRLLPVIPLAWVVLALVFLVGFRVALNVVDSRVIDVGYSGVIGADRITHGKELYGEAPARDNEHGDTYGPGNYLLYVPFEAALPWSGRWDDLPAAHGAAIAFDLLTLLGLLVLGRRLRAGPQGTALGVALAYAWAAYPYSVFVLQSNSNDSLVAMLLVWALVAIASPPARGALVALAAAAKFAPAALLPLFARGRRPRDAAVAVGAAIVVVVAVLVPFVPDGGLREIYDRTIGYQLGRDSPFSLWGQHDSLAPIQTGVKVAAAGLAVAVAFLPRRLDTVRRAALGAAVLIALQIAATHWFYLYVVWFAPLVLVALLARQRESVAPDVGEARRPGLQLDPRGVDHLRDQPVPAR